MNKTFSVSFRLQRVTTETAHVSVLLTTEFMSDDPRTEALNVDKLAKAAIDRGQLPSTIWKLDCEPVITLHPVQTAPDDSSSS
jgi:hypothetical protein